MSLKRLKEKALQNDAVRAAYNQTGLMNAHVIKYWSERKRSILERYRWGEMSGVMYRILTDIQDRRIELEGVV